MTDTIMTSNTHKQATLVINSSAIDTTGITFAIVNAEIENLSPQRLALFTKMTYVAPESAVDAVVWSAMAFTPEQAAAAAEVIAERNPLDEPPLTLQ